jgi:IS30 family transposase
MRQIQEILRIKHQNQLSIREIARSCGLPTSTVGDYLKRAEITTQLYPCCEGCNGRRSDEDACNEIFHDF